MGKSHPDSGPLYLQAMLQAQALASQQTQQAIENKRADEQFAWSQQAYKDAQAQAAPINAQALKNMQQQYGIAEQAQDRYTKTFIPLEDQYIAKAQGWDTPEAEQAAAGAAEANVAQQLQQGRDAASRALQAYGIDPGAPRYANLEIGSRTGGAAATAGAGNQAINQRQQEGLQLLQNASAMGRNLTPTALNAYAGSNASGTGVIGNTNMVNTTGASTMGTGLQWGQLGQQYAGLGNQSIANIGSTFNNLYQGQVAQADAETQGLYGLAGAAVGAVGSAFSPKIKIPGVSYAAEGGAIPESASPTQGIAVDDVPARLSPGEFVVPKDVVQWKGEEHFQKLIDQAREKRGEATAKPDIKPALPVSPRASGGDLPALNRANPRVRGLLKQWQLNKLEQQGIPEGQQLPPDEYSQVTGNYGPYGGDTPYPRNGVVGNPNILYPMRQVSPYDAPYSGRELTQDDVRGRWRGPYTDI